MLPSKHRFNPREKKDFFVKSKKIYSSNFRMFLMNKKGDSQVVVIVPKTKKITAVKRNLIKRKLQAALLSVVKENSGFYVAVIGFDKCLNLSVETISDDFDKKIKSFSN